MTTNKISNHFVTINCLKDMSLQSVKMFQLKNDQAKVCCLLGCDNPYYRGSYNVPGVGETRICKNIMIK